MQPQTQHNYCEHFQHFKPTKKLTIDSKPACKFCLASGCSLWHCLHVPFDQDKKNCGITVCAKNNYLHLASHLQQSKKTKSFHSVFINIHSAEIRCQYCDIEIFDIDQLNQDQRRKLLLTPQSNNPFKFRVGILPQLEELGNTKITGQLEYPQGHRKINRGLVGVFADKLNYSVVPALQFVAHCDFFKDVILSLKLKELKEHSNNPNNLSTSHNNNNQTHSKLLPLLWSLKTITRSIDSATSRAIRIDTLTQQLTKRHPHNKLATYKRKDPFEYVLDFLNILHEYLNFYRVTNTISNVGKDQWDLYYKAREIESHCPVYDSLTSVLGLGYKCGGCGYEEETRQPINFVKLDFPKKRKKAKAVEKELNDKGYQSPRKRGRSLMSMILPQQQLPITVPQLLIEFFKQPFHKEKYCPKCRNTQTPMKEGKVQFKKIADILILQINRMPKNTDQVNDTHVFMSYDQMNLLPFLGQHGEQQPNDAPDDSDNKPPSKQLNYEFQTAIGIENGLFPIVCRSRYNNQLYTIKNESVQMMPFKRPKPINPYIICLKRCTSPQTAQFYEQIMSQNDIIAQTVTKEEPSSYEQTLKQTSATTSSDQSLLYSRRFLPDFYHIQLKHGIELPVYQPMVCKHGRVKPFVENRCEEQVSITEKMYEHLVGVFKGVRYENQVCEECTEEVERIIERKNKEKQLVKEYDSQTTSANVMVSVAWLKKWSNYLYGHETPSYFHKGFPLPPSIDNSPLLEQNKCKPNLVKNRDFKVVNIFVFKLLKQLYSGGPQIRYKWKTNDIGQVDEAKMREIKMQAAELKAIYSWAETQSPKRSFILDKSSSFMETVNEAELEDDFELEEAKELRQTT